MREDEASYRTIRVIAEGGMGSVELAVRINGDFKRLYAIKRLRETHRESDSFRQMFMDEGRIAGLLRHPNVVSVLDVGEDADGPFLVMDYVEGVSVASLLKRGSRHSLELPLSLILTVAKDIARGLDAAHRLRDVNDRELGLVHRDISPQNLLVGVDGIARVTDFGIAKTYGRGTHTETGVIKGKIGYLSPEQLRFDDIDRRSDIFSFGVVLFEMLSGRRLYREPLGGRNVPKRILEEPAPDIAEFREDVPPALVDLIFGMLTKAPDDRISTAKIVLDEIDSIVFDSVSPDERVDVGAYVRDAFEEQLRESRDSTSRALIAATTMTALEHPETAEVSEPLQEQTRETQLAALVSSPQGDRPSRRKRRWIVGAVLALLALGAFVASVPFTQDAETPPLTETPAAMTEDEDDDEVDPQNQERVDDQVEAPPQRDLAAADVPQEVALTEPTTEPPTPRTRPTVRRRRRPRPARPEPSGESIERW